MMSTSEFRTSLPAASTTTADPQEGGGPMTALDRSIVLDAIRQAHGDDRAQLAQSELPMSIDPVGDADLLRKHGVDPDALPTDDAR